MRKRVVSSRFIGRAVELGQLNQALEAAAEGRASVALVGGESGVGKTRLLAELMRGAHDDGALVLAGDCVGVGEQGELPYLSLVSALRPLARASHAALSDAVAPLLPGTARPSEVEQGGQAQLFEGLLALLEALGRQRPVLLVIEDLHWADRSTRAALTFLARSLTVERVLLVGSYRSDELRRGHPLRSLLAELGASRISLEPFTREEMGELIVDVLGEPPAAQQLDRLFARSGGNPLFGEELLAAGLDGSGAAPETLRDALMLRVERLSADARGLLQLVAVGQRVDDGVLEETSALEPGALRDALREAVDAHILTFAGDGLYRFRHALLREVVEADLLPGERAEMHLALARALERRLESDADAQTAATVAHHYARTTDRRAALSSAARAARATQRVHAHDEAAALLERVLELWDRVADAEALAGADRVAILVRAAESASALARPGRQLELLEAAMAELGSEPEPLRAAAILESVAQAQRHMNRTSESIATLERALQLVATGRDRSVRARVLAGAARARMLVGDYEPAEPIARQALELATAAGLPALEASAHNTLGYALALTGSVEEGLAHLREAIRIGVERDALGDIGPAYDNYAEALHLLGRSDEARAVLDEGRHTIGRRRPAVNLWLDLTDAKIAYEVGDLATAARSLPEPHASMGEQARLGIALRRAAIAASRGDDETARALVEELEPLAAASSEPGLLGSIGALVGALQQRRGDLDGARAAVEVALERIDRAGGDRASAAQPAAIGASVAADAAERARDLGDEAAVDEAMKWLDGLLGRIQAAADPGRPVARATLLGAQAEARRAAGKPDADAYARAAAAWEQLGRPEPAAQMRWRQAEALALAGDADAATAAVRTAHAAALRLGAEGLRADVERLAVRARLPLATAAKERGRSIEQDPFGLTQREREVLGLLATGSTNREIGATLFMAEKTASVHVSRILSKLNARSRTEAAAIAFRHGFLEPSTAGRR